MQTLNDIRNANRNEARNDIKEIFAKGDARKFEKPTSTVLDLNSSSTMSKTLSIESSLYASGCHGGMIND